MAATTSASSPTDVETSFPRNKIRILILEKISQTAVNYLVSQGYLVETAVHFTPEELLAKIGDYHVIGIRSKTKLTEEVLRAARRMLCIGHFCIGTDQTNLVVARELGIPVFNSPFANTRSVAELVLAQMIIMARKAGDQNRFMHDGIWRKTAKGCYEVRGKTLGIIGYGHVGSQLSVLAEALGFRVIYYDIIPKLPLGNARPVASMEILLRTADFVSLHVPATPMTIGMIDREQVEMMKKGSYLCNAARGKVVNIDVVAEALKSEHLAGAYFDVYPSEPIDETLVLRNCPNTVLTPHIGGSTQEAQSNIGLEVAEKIARYINEGKTIAACNFPEVDLQPNFHAHRILNVHRNVPGVLRKINNILENYNISAQVMRSEGGISYLLVDVDADRSLSKVVKREIDRLDESIRTRVVYSPGAL